MRHPISNRQACGARVISLGLARARKAGAPVGAGAAAFAAQVAARYDDASGVVQPVARVLACPQPHMLAQQIEQRCVLNVAPRIVLQFTTGAASTRTAAASNALAPIVPQPSSTPAFASALVQRIVQRVERVSLLDGGSITLPMAAPTPAPDVVHTASASAGGAETMAPTSNRTSRVLRRAAAMAPASVSTPATAPVREDAPAAAELATRQPRANAVTPTRVPAQFDVEALADRVVRVIDRRLTAQRERFGRL